MPTEVARTPFVVRAARWSCRLGGGAAALEPYTSYDVELPEDCIELTGLSAHLDSSEQWLGDAILKSAFVTLYSSTDAFFATPVAYIVRKKTTQGGSISIARTDKAGRPIQNEGHILFNRRTTGVDQISMAIDFFEKGTQTFMPLFERLNWLLMEAELKGDKDWGVDLDVFLHCTCEEHHAE